MKDANGVTLRPGQLVDLHPTTKLWMRGIKWGDVVRVGRKWVHVGRPGTADVFLVAAHDLTVRDDLKRNPGGDEERAAPYAWIIDTDPEGFGGVGTIGPGVASDRQVEMLRAGSGQPFRMLDDDGILMYTGRFLGDAESEWAFGPLDDFGTPNVGATTIEYYTSQGWQAL